jgi:PAS domain S-box-containing protein
MENIKIFDPSWVLDSIYNGIISINEEGVITYFNKTAERIFDIPADEVTNRFIQEVLPNISGRLMESLKTGRALYGEKIKRKKMTLISNFNPLVKNGKICGVVGVFQDISEIESISKELDLFKNLKDWLDTIIDSSYDGLWICDHEAKVIRLNKAAERINQVKANDILGKSMKELVDQGLFDKSGTLEVLKRKTTVTMIQEVKGGNKILVTSSPIFDERGEIAFVVSNDRDISELDHLRSQLQETKALAKEYSSKLSELEMRGVDLSTIIFRSLEMERIVEMALRMAEVDTTVLLLGESGVGKGVIAKLIHKQSNRKTGPFIRVDCASIPESLMESELFGYEKGAFTGAGIEGKPGFFELADTGTLLLDEIGEIPLSSQSKLLRFLEDHEIYRVGGTKSRKIDVRIIAASNKNIEQMVSSKLFREDLYYRLNVVPVLIPPLRNRREDILPLVLHYLEKFNKAYQKKKTLSPEAIDALCSYDFSGNIRELANLVERFVVATEKDRVELTDLPGVVEGRMPTAMPYALPVDDVPLRYVLELVEGLIIERTIKRHGSQREAAKILKVNQGTLSRKLKKYSSSKNDVLIHKLMQ